MGGGGGDHLEIGGGLIMEFQCPTPEELVVFYAQNHASKKLVKGILGSSP